ncbi:hypothetical protein [Pseudomonas putida]|uniref:hypothetical protein n=1 Tax=Pseudomonas putida TaxID=303 RepID=UPI000E0CCE04|nr:hypothetical protein [Pseudomonas putida]MCI1037701.1 hypothetical protein [Pseudomonas putida]WQE52184.1 hypothetical protein U0028_20215 [Pseudomonas putida]GLO05672.1 hypothetical protein PPUJ13061_55760 [Pseudomonas putida]HDS1009102.1 hypothetical protein [Pseudomonas putida]
MSQPLKAQKILDALAQFKQRMVEASTLRAATSDRLQTELRALKTEKEREHEYNDELKELPRSIYNMVYHDLRTGRAEVYGSKRSFLDDQIASAHLHTNRHYQWVLAEAYEAFEDFLENLYAGMGYMDADFWPMTDFGNIRMSELPNKDYEWFNAQVKQKKNKPGSILNIFRASFKELRELETKNKLNCHAGFELILISKLRHLIVHNSGKAENKDEVIKRMLSEAGISEKYKDALTARANLFFRKLKGADEIHVYLLGHSDPQHPVISAYNLTDFLGFMVSYAQIITEHSMAHLYLKGLIDQPTGEQQPGK